MTIAIQRDNEGADTIFFDAVLSYNETYNSKLTSHPIDGANTKNGIYTVNDHIAHDNPTFTLRGVISSADLGTGRPNNASTTLINHSEISDYARVTSTTESLFQSVVDVALPFGQNAEPEVVIGTRSGPSLSIIKSLLISLRDSKEIVTLVEFVNRTPTQYELDLVITSLQFSVDPDSGDALHVDMTLQRANFVELQWTKTPHPVDASKTSGKTKDAAQPTVNKGWQVSEEKLTSLQKSLEVGMDTIKRLQQALGSKK